MKSDDCLRTDLSAEEFSLFRDWIQQHSGIFMEESKSDSLRVSLVTRASRYGICDYADYFRLLSADEDEFKELMNLVTINETSFFRFPAQFEALSQSVIPQIAEGRHIGHSTPFSVWSAGCSTGEEPYTVAMTLLDSALADSGSPCRVVGTDVSTQALERARAGYYHPRALSSLDQGVVERWFEETEQGWRPIERVRELCEFHYHNLIRQPYGADFQSGWDVIFCRNVTIYFRIESTKRIIEHFYEALNPGGYLFIGHSETLTSVSSRFETIEVDGAFLYRKPAARHSFTFAEVASARVASAPAGVPRGARDATGARTSDRLRQRATKAACSGASADVAPATAASPRTIVSAGGAAAAHALLDDARPAEALELATRHLEQVPEDLEAKLVLAFAHADLGNLETAAQQAQSILSENPLIAPARYILGAIRREQGDVDAATAEFRRTLYIDPEFVLAHFALANIHHQRGDIGEAAREYENTLRVLYVKPEGSWTAFLGGFKPDLLARTCERGLSECRKSLSGV